LKLEGSELFDIDEVARERGVRQELGCVLTRADGSSERITLVARLDTLQEVEYYFHGGTFQFVIRNRLAA
jgi:aconitate hydratase